MSCMKRFVAIVGIAVFFTGLVYGQIRDQDEYEETSLIGYEFWRDEAEAGETKQFKAVVLYGSRSETTLLFHDLYNTANSLSFVANQRYPDMTSGQMVTIYFTANKSGLRILRDIEFGTWAPQTPVVAAAGPAPVPLIPVNPLPAAAVPVDPAPTVPAPIPIIPNIPAPQENPAPARSTYLPVPTYPPPSNPVPVIPPPVQSSQVTVTPESLPQVPMFPQDYSTVAQAGQILPPAPPAAPVDPVPVAPDPVPAVQLIPVYPPVVIPIPPAPAAPVRTEDYTAELANLTPISTVIKENVPIEPLPTPSAPIPSRPALPIPGSLPPAQIIGSLPPADGGGVFRLQIGAYKNEGNAIRVFNQLKNMGLNPAYERVDGIYRIVLSGIPGGAVLAIAEQLGAAGFQAVLSREER
jgi:hypothetical protein